MSPSRILLWGAVVLRVAVAAADDEVDRELAIVAALAPSLAVVEYELAYDRGEPPEGPSLSYRCPECGSVHTANSGEQMIGEERPLEAPAFLIGPDTVVSRDISVPDRFIRAIRVRWGDQRVGARRTAYAIEQEAVFLKLDRAPDGARPLAFDPAAPGPYDALTFSEVGGTWTATLDAGPGGVAVDATGRRYVAVVEDAVIVDEGGTPVGLAIDGELAVDDSWKGSPGGWPVVSEAQRLAMFEKLGAVADRAVLRVKLGFRSPPGGEAARFGLPLMDRHGLPDDADSTTELQVPGVLVDRQRLLVLADLGPRTTARLERIGVFVGDAEPVPASFGGSLADYGALVATLEKPLDGALKLAEGSILEQRHRLLVHARIRVSGEERIADLSHSRIRDFQVGWRGRCYPQLAGDGGASFLFEPDGTLLALPLGRRARPGAEAWSSDDALLTPAVHLAGELGDLDRHVDPANAPQAEGDSTRLAWLGVVLQGLNRDLARARKVAVATQDGEIGALVSYVYPQSPAAEAGIEPGAILLRLLVARYPRPIDVRCDELEYDGAGFAWEQLDEVLEQSPAQLPPPWPPVENSFTQMLTDLGFGTAYSAIFLVDGRKVAKDFVVSPSPPHYGSAPRYESARLGLTVRDITYEVRRHFQMAPDEPGVIISKVEPGSKAAVAGIRPYEQITHVNGEAVPDVKQFERLTAGADELRLSVRWMDLMRQVRVR